jgi:hypothetical protein
LEKMTLGLQVVQTINRLRLLDRLFAGPCQSVSRRCEETEGVGERGFDGRTNRRQFSPAIAGRDCL